MSYTTLCDISEIAQLLGIPFAAAVRYQQAVDGTLKHEVLTLPVITRRHSGCLGALEVIL